MGAGAARFTAALGAAVVAAVVFSGTAVATVVFGAGINGFAIGFAAVFDAVALHGGGTSFDFIIDCDGVTLLPSVTRLVDAGFIAGTVAAGFAATTTTIGVEEVTPLPLERTTFDAGMVAIGDGPDCVGCCIPPTLAPTARMGMDDAVAVAVGGIDAVVFTVGVVDVQAANTGAVAFVVGAAATI